MRRSTRRATLTVQSTDSVDGRYLWADVVFDGRPAGKTALTLERLRPGKHRVTIHRRGYRAVKRSVWLRAGRRALLRVALEKKR